MNTQRDEELLRYLDGALSEQEVKKLTDELLQSADLTNRLNELEQVHQFLKRKAKLEVPSKNFTQRVMANLDQVPQTATLSPRNGLYLLLGVVVASGILITLLSNGLFNGLSTTLSVDNPIPNTNLIDVSKISLPFDSKTIVKGIIFVNLALAFVMLDRTILKPLFRQRNETSF